MDGGGSPSSNMRLRRAVTLSLAIALLVLPVPTTFANDQAGSRVNCGPEREINPTGTQHTVTCTVRSGTGASTPIEGADVDYQVTGANPTGPQHGCTTAVNGSCSFTYTGNNAGNDMIQAFVNQDGVHTNNDCGAEATADAESDDFCDQVEKTWQARTATFLDVEPETDTNPNGSTHTLTATFTDQFGDPIDFAEGQLVDIEIISGPNANLAPGFRDFECPSNNPTQGGTCTATYTDAAAFDQNNATDTICAWPSTDGDDDQYDPNGSTADGGDCDAETPNETELGVDPNNQPIPGNEGNDTTDTVLKTWTASSTAPATQVNAEPETDTNPVGTQHTIGAFAGSANNQATTATPIRGDILPGSANAGQQSGAEVNCVADTTPGPGITFPQGQTQSHECSYTGANAGTDTIRVFADSNGNSTFDQGEPFDDVTKEWTPGGSGSVTALNAGPERATSPQGAQHQVAVTLTGAAGPVQGVTPNSIIASNAAGRPQGDVANPNSGASPNAAPGNYNVYDCTPSNAEGVSTCTYTDTPAGPLGTDTIVFYVNQAGGGTAGPDAGEPQDAVQNTWAARREHPRKVSIRLRHREGTLVVFGVLSTTEDEFGPCVAGKRLKLQRRAGDKWVTRATPKTDENGGYLATIRDRRGLYRVIAPQTAQTASDGFTDICLATRNQRLHRH